MEHMSWPWIKERISPHLEEMRFSPPYPNAGVIVASAETMRRIGAYIYEDLDTVGRMFRLNLLIGQMALSLSIHRAGVEWSPLPLRYNCPNVREFHDTYPDIATDIRVLHYMQSSEIDRVADFQSYDHVERAMNRTGLSVLNTFFVDRLRSVHLAKVLPDLQQLSA
jgi:hypothetical protein